MKYNWKNGKIPTDADLAFAAGKFNAKKENYEIFQRHRPPFLRADAAEQFYNYVSTFHSKFGIGCSNEPCKLFALKFVDVIHEGYVVKYHGVLITNGHVEPLYTMPPGGFSQHGDLKAKIINRPKEESDVHYEHTDYGMYIDAEWEIEFPEETVVPFSIVERISNSVYVLTKKLV